MTEPRKATKAPAPDLSLYALAQVRASEIERALSSRCGSCTGERCDQPMRVSVAGRPEWPSCPLAMLRTPTWRQIVDTYVAAKISPIVGWPDAFCAFAFDGLIELHSAVKSEEQRQRQHPTTGPVFSGRRSRHLEK